MPDFDRDLAVLRTDLRDSVHQPDLDDVIARSRQRTTRRRTLRTSLRPGADRPVTPATTGSMELPLESPYLLDIDYADERHGYALRTTCINGRPPGCANQLLVTADGEHWESRAMPPALAGANAVPLLRVLGPSTVVLRREVVAGLQYYSTDAGRSWQEGSSGRTWIPHILPTNTADYFSLATDGHALFLTAHGQLANLTPPRTIGLEAIFRSTDGGTSWQQTWKAKDGVEPRAVDGDLIAAADGRLIVSTYLGPVWASSDGGTSFQQVPDAEISGHVFQTGAGYLVGPAAGVSNVYKYSTDGMRWKEISVG